MPVNGTVTHTATACSSNADCATGEFCDTLAPVGAQPGTCGTVPTDGNGWKLGSEPLTIALPAAWRGRFFPRVNCSDATGEFHCDSGQCVDDANDFSLYCAASGVPPTTVAEVALIPGEGATDTYDVSQVNGFNVPIQMAPNTGTYAQTANHYVCGSPGCTATTCSATANQTACGWTMTDASQCPNGLRFVALTPGAAITPCATDADCGSATPTPTPVGVTAASAAAPLIEAGQMVCGANNNSDQLACGPYAGCLSPGSACADVSNDDPPLACGTMVSGQGNLADLYSCAGPNADSCYTANVGDTCCGCPAWTSTYDGSASCQNHNSAWQIPAGKSYPGCLTDAPPAPECLIQTFKESCPQAYSFPYDDPTSTFTCNNGAAQLVDYTITFCPAN